MVRATLTITVKPGKEEEFVRVWQEIAEHVRHNTGNVRQTLLRSADEERTFVVASDWGSREAFTEFERSPEQDDLTAPIRALRESGRMTVQEIVVDVEGGGP
jgi:heme-degrading monooxygenase HmoA